MTETATNGPGGDPAQGGVCLPARVAVENSRTPVDVFSEEGRVTLRQEGRNTMIFTPDTADELCRAVAAAAAEADAAAPDAAVLTLAPHR